jgi:type IX secretion system PorP/SprF family membrane protein
MRCIYKLLLLHFLLISAACATAQDFTFSQFYEAPLLRNPSLAGVFDGDVRLSGVFRNQWQSVTVPYQTTAASAEMKFPIYQQNDWLTVGMQVTNDEAGDIKLRRTALLPVLNYHKSLGGNYDNYLSLAFMGGPVSNQFDPTKLRMDDQFVNGEFDPNNPTQTFERTGFSYWDASAGLTYNAGFGEDSKYYIGAAMFHLNNPKVAFYTNNDDVFLKRKYAFNAGLSTPTSDINNLVLFADYFVQGGNKQFLGGALYGIDIAERYYDDDDQKLSLYLGGAYRWNDAVIPTVKLNMYNLGVGMSYDVNISQLKTASQFRGGFELTLSYKAKFTSRSANSDRVKCVGIKF